MTKLKSIALLVVLFLCVGWLQPMQQCTVLVPKKSQFRSPLTPAGHADILGQKMLILSGFLTYALLALENQRDFCGTVSYALLGSFLLENSSSVEQGKVLHRHLKDFSQLFCDQDSPEDIVCVEWADTSLISEDDFDADLVMHPCRTTIEYSVRFEREYNLWLQRAIAFWQIYSQEPREKREALQSQEANEFFGEMFATVWQRNTIVELVAVQRVTVKKDESVERGPNFVPSSATLSGGKTQYYAQLSERKKPECVIS